jgi:hypothetical protein
MRRFPPSPITALIDEKPQYNLGESMGPELTVADLLGPAGPAGLAGVKLGYGTSAGDPALRALISMNSSPPSCCRRLIRYSPRVAHSWPMPAASSSAG